MDDGRLANLLFLGGLASLAMPGCSSTAGPEDVGTPRPVGNPLEDDNALTDGRPDEPGGTPDPGAGPGSGRGEGGGGGGSPCAAYASRQEECGDGGGGYYGYDYDYDDYRQQCEELLEQLEEYWGEGCRQAWVDLFACVAMQDCQSFACSSEQTEADIACGQAEPGTTGG